MTIGIAVNDLTLQKKTGVERYVENLLSAMMTFPLKDGDCVRLYVSKMPTNISLPKGWEWRVLPFRLSKGWTHVRLSWELWRNPPDVFFNPSHEIPFFVPSKTRVVSTVHDVAFRVLKGLYSNKNAWRQEWAIRRVVKRAATVLAVSEATKNDLVTLFHVPPERIVATPLGVDAATFVVDAATRDAVLTRYRLAADRYVLFVGRLEEKKNVTTLIRAFSEFTKSLGVGHPIELVLAGTWGFGSEKIKNVLNKHSDGVRVLGFVPDVDLPALYSGARCFCFPSFYEGFGLPMLEAMAAGTAVIASDIPALREVVGDAAKFVPPNDIAGWTHALRSVIVEHSEREAMIARGKARAAAATWRATAQKTWGVFFDRYV